MSALIDVATEHRDRLIAHVEVLPRLADLVATTAGGDAAKRIAEEHAFLKEALLPHMASVETALYPELDRLLSCRLAMTPMAREHERIRALVARLGEAQASSGASGSGATAEMSFLLRQLHDVLETHLREESRYVPILEHNLGPDETAALADAFDRPIGTPA